MTGSDGFSPSHCYAEEYALYFVGSFQASHYLLAAAAALKSGRTVDPTLGACTHELGEKVYFYDPVPDL